MMRKEDDSLGSINVEDKFYWGAQTQRCLNLSNIRYEPLPQIFMESLLKIKICCAQTNNNLGKLEQKLADQIVFAANDIIKQKFPQDFPLSIWQVGAGTVLNMNINEVISNIANEKLGNKKGSKAPIHPNDHVNMGQSTNDVIPTAINISIIQFLTKNFLPALNKLYKSLEKCQKKWSTIIKVGRTHLQDATLMSLGQEFGGYAAQIKSNINRINSVLHEFYFLPQGGKAIGVRNETFAKVFIKYISDITGEEFKLSPNTFEAISSCDSYVSLSGILNTLAIALIKIVKDIRLMVSGPRCGFQELIQPANEPGSSIMPGKINPTQCDLLEIICAQVIGNHNAVSIGGLSGIFELNIFKIFVFYNLFQSMELLENSMLSFIDHCIEKLLPNVEQLKDFRDKNLSLSTYLSPVIGYDKACQISQISYEKNISLKQAALDLGFLTEKEFDIIISNAVLKIL